MTLVIGPHDKNFHTGEWPVAQVRLVSSKIRGVLPIRGGGSWPTPW